MPTSPAHDSTSPTPPAPPAATTPAAPAPDPLLERIDALADQVGKAHAALERLERARRIEHVVRSARAVDPAVAAELVEHAIAESDGKLTPDAALAQVQRRRPGLFKPHAASGSSVMSPRVEPASTNAAAAGADPAALAQRVAAGDHRAILAFMRARRGTS